MFVTKSLLRVSYQDGNIKIQDAALKKLDKTILFNLKSALKTIISKIENIEEAA